MKAWSALVLVAAFSTLASRTHAQSAPGRRVPDSSVGTAADPPPGPAPPNAGPDSAAEPPGKPSPPATPAQRAQPAAVPNDPLAIPEQARERIGTDWTGPPPPPTGETKRSFKGFLEASRGEVRFRILPPLYLEHTRAPGTPREDSEALYGTLYYRRRSLNVDADVLFPALWRLRERQNNVLVLGPLVHREAPGEHDNWLAPLAFTGSRRDGGYFHLPPLLTTSHWDEKGAFTLVGPYFRKRSGSDVDWGILPLVFRGDNGDVDGNRRTYTLIPPFLFYNRQRELEQSGVTLVGPVYAASDPKRSIFDVLPLFFHIQGRPETGGVRESHTTLFPFFHYGTGPEQSLFIVPGYLRRVTPTADTLITPLFSHATARKNSTEMTLAGPVLPVFYRYVDRDVSYAALGVFPFFFHASDPTGSTLLTPLFGRFESVGVSRTHWFFPTLSITQDQKGWDAELHPLVYLGRKDDHRHTVLAPLYWDFGTRHGRTTIGFPLLWRFADHDSQSVTQVVANTLFLQKRTSAGLSREFHFLPLFSYGSQPNGHFWNVLFGLAGYSRAGSYSQIRALWIPITLSSGPENQTASRDGAAARW